MTIRHLLLASSCALAVGLPSARGASANRALPVDAPLSTDSLPCASTPSDATAAEIAHYAAREAAAGELGEFAGGHSGAGIGVAAVVVLAVLLVVILF
ncbi:MAG: hypothetical protein JNL90_02625 [Planctomycetes bacterium]|nr:hypothetical protein [Planctomycetota bacterium]